MNDNRQQSRRGNYHKRRKNRPQIQYPSCPVCSQSVRDIYAAITHEESQQPAHFDCILKILRNTNHLDAGEKICYLGKGSFGIIQQRTGNSSMRFFIRKRIQYEVVDPAPEWKKKYQYLRNSR